MKAKIGINGFGRIGRQVLKAIKKYHSDAFDVVAINDLYAAEDNARLFKYDSNYGIYPGTVEVKNGNLVVDGDEIKVFAERDPGKLPWKDLGVDIVIESTGIFRDTSKKPGPQSHIEAGAKKVIICGMDGYKGVYEDNLKSFYKPELYAKHRISAKGDSVTTQILTDTNNFEALTSKLINSYAKKYGIKLPPIYNCSENSIYKMFPKIPYSKLREVCNG